MKAISLRAPWFYAITHLGKTVENRRWATRYRGQILLHASRWFDDLVVAEDLNAIAHIVPMQSMPELAQLRAMCGLLVGRACLVDCVRVSSSPWFTGPVGLVLTDAVPLAEPRPYRGALGLFEVT